MPVAPLGRFPSGSSICGVPSASAHLTSKVCLPAAKGQSYRQITQVVSERGALKLAVCQGPLSTLTSTFEIPRAPAKAMPPTGTSLLSPLSIMSFTATVSMTEVAFTRATSSQFCSI
jgi:hypothetical protein